MYIVKRLLVHQNCVVTFTFSGSLGPFDSDIESRIQLQSVLDGFGDGVGWG